MRRTSTQRSGTKATLALFAVTLLLAGTAFGGWAAVAAPGVHAASTSLAAPKIASTHVASATHPGAISATLKFTSAFTNYLPLPYNLAFSVTTTGGSVAVGSTWVNVEIRDVASICQGGLGLTMNCPTVVNISLNSSVTNGATSFSVPITTVALEAGQFRVSCPSGGPPCSYNGGVLPNDQYQILAWVEYNDSGTFEWFSVEQTAYLITTNQTATLAAPAPGGAVSTGNVTVGITYAGSYVSGASVAIYQGTSAAGTEVYSQSVFAPGLGAETVLSPTAWYASTAGQYFVVMTLSAPYGNANFTQALTVIQTGGTVYHNQSSWNNASLIPGLSTSVGGTLLLVVGLLIGMIVALVLGRMMWGGSSAAAPAQPWQAKNANECSVCHQSFATDAELKEHAKTAHGMN